MLEYLGKVVSRNDLLETLAIYAQHGVRMNGNIIFGWGNLLPSDLEELERFLDQLPKGVLTTAQFRWLYATRTL